MSELRAQTNLNAGHGPWLVPTISSRSGGVQLSLPMHDFARFFLLRFACACSPYTTSLNSRSRSKTAPQTKKRVPRDTDDYEPSPDS